LQQAVARAVIEAIRVALAATHGRRNEAAELLGITRKTLWEKMRNYSIEAES
jgi:DNA-binding NtrC family response regulator